MKKEYSGNRELSCSFECNQAYLDCIGKGEHESVCALIRVPCDCACSA